MSPWGKATSPSTKYPWLKVKPRSDQVFRSAYHFTGGEECDKTTPSGYN